MTTFYNSLFRLILEQIKQEPASYNDLGLIRQYFNDALDTKIREYHADLERGLYKGTTAQDKFQAETLFQDACTKYKHQALAFILEYQKDPEAIEENN
jgi:hypothetical protein